jgi:hypothetical protein
MNYQTSPFCLINYLSRLYIFLSIPIYFGTSRLRFHCKECVATLDSYFATIDLNRLALVKIDIDNPFDLYLIWRVVPGLRFSGNSP